MNEYIPLGDTRDVFRIAKFVKLLFFASCYCTRIMLSAHLSYWKKIFADF